MEETISRENLQYWKNIYLIGYMGTGKTTTAVQMGKILDMQVIELDRVIEEYYGKPIPDIFDEINEEGFRALETVILATTISGTFIPYDLSKGAIFSCGGGIVLNNVNISAMQNSGRVVWLTAKPETVLKRLTSEAIINFAGDDDSELESDGDTSNGRPLLKGKMNINDITEMMEIREPYYLDACDYIINTDEKTPDEVAGEIIIALDLIPSVS